MPHFLRAEFGNVDAVKNNAAACRLHQPQNGAANRRFAAAGFPHDAQGFAFFQGKTHAIDRMEHAFGNFIIFFEILDLQ